MKTSQCQKPEIVAESRHNTSRTFQLFCHSYLLVHVLHVSTKSTYVWHAFGTDTRTNVLTGTPARFVPASMSSEKQCHTNALIIFARWTRDHWLRVLTYVLKGRQSSSVLTKFHFQSWDWNQHVEIRNSHLPNVVHWIRICIRTWVRRPPNRHQGKNLFKDNVAFLGCLYLICSVIISGSKQSPPIRPSEIWRESVGEPINVKARIGFHSTYRDDGRDN